MLFNRPTRAVLPQIGRKLININKDDEYYEAFNQGKNSDTHKNSTFLSTVSTVAVQREKGVCGHMEWS